MRNIKKRTALILGLLLSASSAAMPAELAYAETATQSSSQSSEEESKENVSEGDSDTNTDEKEIISTEDYDYTLTDEGNICIENTKVKDKNLVVPETIDGKKVTELGKTAFGNTGRSVYQTISLPATIEYISSNNPFSPCPFLEEIKVASENENYFTENGVLYTKDMKTLVSYPAAKKGDSFTIPSTVSKICSAAFYNSDLKEVTFPQELSEMQSFAFSSSKNLTKIDLSKTALTQIDGYCFSYCDMLADVSLPEDLNLIGGAAFAGCKSLENITLPSKLTSVQQYSFVDTGLKKITVPDSVTEIGYCAFGYSTGKNGGSETPDPDFIIVGSIGSAAQRYSSDSDSDYDYQNEFKFRTPQEDADLSEIEALDLKTQDEYQYAIKDGKAILVACISTSESITVPEKFEDVPVETIFPTAFSGCTKATQITLPNSIKLIRKLAFYGCESLKSITLPQSVEEIEDNVFDCCIALEDVDLGGAVKIGEQIFNECTALKTVKISGNCTSIAENAENPFTYCTNLEAINVSEGDGAYSSENGVLYNKEKTSLLHYPAAKSDKKFKVPKGVEDIAGAAFTEAKNLETIDISEVKVIGIYSFAYCENLKNVKLSKNLEKIGDYAFFNDEKLTSLRFYDNLKTIGEYAFGYKYDEEYQNDDGTVGGPVVMTDFKVYAEENTPAYNVCKDHDIKVVSGTVAIFGLNINKTIVALVIGGISAAVVVAILRFILKKSKKNKNKTANETVSSSDKEMSENGEETGSENENNTEKETDHNDN